MKFLLAEYRQDVVRVQRTIHPRLAGLQTLAFLHVDVDATLYRVFRLLAVVRF
jgi:hypothetical protein